MSVTVDNPYDQLASSPIADEGKSDFQSRKDDIKEQAYQAKEGVKARILGLKEEVVNSGLLASASSKLQSGVQLAKQQVASLTGNPAIASEDNAEAAEAAAGEWETVKSRGAKLGKKAVADAQGRVQQQVDENLTPAQKAKLSRGVKQAQAAGKQANAQARGAFNFLFSAPQLRGVKGWIQRNNLQLPVMIGLTLATLWMGLTLIRLVTTMTTPKVPEFDIHSKEASLNWLKYHAGEYKDKAAELSDSIPARVAKFLANHEVDKIKEQAMDKADLWREIGMKKLGLAEPTMGEQAWAWLTGRPLTWQGRVESVLDLAKSGLKATALKQGISAGYDAAKGSVKDSLGLNEPTLTQRIINRVTGHDDSLSGRVKDSASSLGDRASSLGDRAGDYIKAHIPGFETKEPTLLDNLKGTISEGVDSIRSHLPGGAEAVAEAKARAYAATHPSTLDSIKVGAEYVKNRIVHGAQEAAHIAQDRANELADKAKYKTGL